MGCLNSRPNASFKPVNDDIELLEDTRINPKYDFAAEYNTQIDCNIKYKETVSRRPSVSISIANIEFAHQLQNTYNSKHAIEKKQQQQHTQEAEEEKENEPDNNNNNVFIKKYFKSDEWNSLSFRREASILSKISHNNIIKYITSYHDEMAYFLLIEYCSNGTLISYIYNNHKSGKLQYNQLLIHDIISTLISITSYIHKLNIVHRNICLENILIDDNGLYKLIGWDDAEIIENKHDVYNDFVGSNIYYLSPETVRIRHGWELKKIDMFAIGVCAFLLSFGIVPFSGLHQTRIIKKIVNNNYSYPKTYVSKPLKTFIKSLLSPYPYSRMSANEAKYSDYIKTKPNQNNNNMMCSDIDNVPFKLYCYDSSMKISKLLIQNKCNNWTHFEQNELIKVFENIFSLQKEEINTIDLEKLLIKMGLNKNESQKKSQQLFFIMDPEQTGCIKIKSFHLKKNYKMHPFHVNGKQGVNSSSGKNFEYSPVGVHGQTIHQFDDDYNDDNSHSSLSQMR